VSTANYFGPQIRKPLIGAGAQQRNKKSSNNNLGHLTDSDEDVDLREHA
jgi:hypothetical protein